MPTIGLTGNFGMGKSSVLGMFGRMGAHTFDIDSFVHSILERDVIIRKVAEVLDNSVVTRRAGKNRLIKKRVADMIFKDTEKRSAVESVIHPEVLKLIKQAEADILKKDPGAVVVFEVPLLFEAGYEKYFDSIVVVYSSRKSALKRLEGKGFNAEEVRGRMGAQMPISTKLKQADYTVNNNFGLQRTEKRVRQIFEEVMGNRL